MYNHKKGVGYKLYPTPFHNLMLIVKAIITTYNYQA